MTNLQHIHQQTELALQATILAVRAGDIAAAVQHAQDVQTYMLAPLLSQIYQLENSIHTVSQIIMTASQHNQPKDPNMSKTKSVPYVEVIRAHIKEQLLSNKDPQDVQAAAYSQCRVLATTNPDPIKAARILSICQAYVRAYFDARADFPQNPRKDAA